MRKEPLVCKSCGLFNKAEGVCSVSILRAGEYYEITTKADDKCHWEEMGIPVQQVRMWSDGQNGYVEMAEHEGEQFLF